MMIIIYRGNCGKPSPTPSFLPYSQHFTFHAFVDNNLWKVQS